MEFSIDREALLKPLQTVAGVVERRQTLPILSNVLLSLHKQVLSLVGTDLEVEWVARVPLEGQSAEGEFTVPARKLLDIVKALPEKTPLSFRLDGQRVILKAGKGRYTLATLPAEEYPRLQEGPGALEFSLTQSALHQLMEKTHFSMAVQDVRFYLNGMLWDIQGDHIRTVATDGHRLATHREPLSLTENPHKQVILPRKAILELNRVFVGGEEDLGIVIGDNHFRAITPKFSFTTKLIEGSFPNYRQVVPKGDGDKAVVSRERFKQMLSRVSVLLQDKHRGASFQIDNNVLRAKARNADQDEVEEEIEIEYEGPEHRIGFNISYLQEFLTISKAALIQMTISDPGASVLFEAVGEDESLYVVMPMRL